MSDYGRGQVALLTSPHPAVDVPQRRVDAVTLLTCYLVLLMAIPSTLTVGSFGAAGAPAALFAVIALAWYLLSRQHPGLGMARGRQPIRVAVVCFGCAIVAAYVSANRHAMPTAQQSGADRGLILLAGWLGLAAAGRRRTRSRGPAEGSAPADCPGATVLAALGMAEFFTGTVVTKYIVILAHRAQPVDGPREPRRLRPGHRDGGTAAQLAAVLAMSLPLAIHQARFAPPALRLRRWVQVALIAGTISMTVSRSAIAAGRYRRGPHPDLDEARAAPRLPGRCSPRLSWRGRRSPACSAVSRGCSASSARTPAACRGPMATRLPCRYNSPPLARPRVQDLPPADDFFVHNQYLTSLIETGMIGLAGAGGTPGDRLVHGPERQARGSPHPDPRPRACLAASPAAGALSFGTSDALSFTIAPGRAPYRSAAPEHCGGWSGRAADRRRTGCRS